MSALFSALLVDASIASTVDADHVLRRPPSSIHLRRRVRTKENQETGDWMDNEIGDSVSLAPPRFRLLGSSRYLGPASPFSIVARWICDIRSHSASTHPRNLDGVMLTHKASDAAKYFTVILLRTVYRLFLPITRVSSTAGV